RIKTALKQTPLCEGSPKGQRAGVCFLGYFFCTSKRSDSPAGEKGIFSARINFRKQSEQLHSHAEVENENARSAY
ncbi:MAG TPA: hypothetical protein VFY78_05380, partial [Gammaproteobacteria bacterium]|nr:hypothetical protein [Gammaproteobacteria bacterium]